MPKSRPLFQYALMRAGACVPLAWIALSAGVAQGQGAPSADPTKPYEDLIDTYCVKCHNTTDWAGDMALDTMDLAHTGQDAQIW